MYIVFIICDPDIEVHMPYLSYIHVPDIEVCLLYS